MGMKWCVLVHEYFFFEIKSVTTLCKSDVLLVSALFPVMSSSISANINFIFFWTLQEPGILRNSLNFASSTICNRVTGILAALRAGIVVKPLPD